MVPVKVLALAKSRLAPVAGLKRPELALAMAQDTVSAALACWAVAQVMVVTRDPAARRELAALGAVIVADDPGAGLNAALRQGAAASAGRWPGAGIAALTADLPALRPADLGAGLRAAAGSAQAFVADADGTGTTLYTARPGAPFRPRFGPGSAARHRAAGAAEIAAAGLDRLRRDVDAPPDLCRAEALGLGTRTAAVTAALRAAGSWAPVRCGLSGRSTSG